MKKFTDFLKEGERGLWDNIHAKQERIKNGSGERMRKPGSKGAPTDAALKASQNEELTPEQLFDLIEEMAGEISEELQMDLEQVWEELDEFNDNELLEACNCWKGYKRKPGTKPCADDSCIKEESGAYEKSEENKRSADAAKKQGDMFAHHLHMADHHDNLAQWHSEKGRHRESDRHAKKSEEHQEKAMGFKESIDEAAVDAKGYKSSTGGLTQKGRDAYNRKEGSHLKAPVTTPPSKLKKGSKAANRRKSFCARMSGVEGPMRKPNGEPTRKALALRKWNC